VRNAEGKNAYRIRREKVVPIVEQDETFAITDEADDDSSSVVDEAEDDVDDDVENATLMVVDTALEPAVEIIPTFDMFPSSPTKQFKDTILFSAVEGLRGDSEKLVIDTSFSYSYDYCLPTPVTPPYTYDSCSDPDLDEEVDRYLDISEENSEQMRVEYTPQVIERFSYLDRENLTIPLLSTVKPLANPIYRSSIDGVEFYIMWVDKLPIIRLASNKMINAGMLLSIGGVAEDEMILSFERIVQRIDEGVCRGAYIPLKRAGEFARTFGCLDSLRVFLGEGVGELFEE
jgi:hypothetical protein